MKTLLCVLVLILLQGCAAMGKGADWYNRHGPGFSVTLPFLTLSINPRLQNPPVDADVGFGPQPPPVTQPAPEPGNEIAGK